MFLVLLVFVSSDNSLEKAKAALIILFLFVTIRQNTLSLMFLPCVAMHIISHVHDCATVPPTAALMLQQSVG